VNMIIVNYHYDVTFIF